MMSIKKQSFFHALALMLGLLSTNLKAIEPKTKTFLWAGGAITSGVVTCAAYLYGKKLLATLGNENRLKLLNPKEIESMRNQLWWCNVIMGGGGATTIFSSVMAIKSGYDWKNASKKPEGGEPEDGEPGDGENDEEIKIPKLKHGKKMKLLPGEYEAPWGVRSSV
jgi:hypothetical protein